MLAKLHKNLETVKNFGEKERKNKEKHNPKQYC